MYYITFYEALRIFISIIIIFINFLNLLQTTIFSLYSFLHNLMQFYYSHNETIVFIKRITNNKSLFVGCLSLV